MAKKKAILFDLDGTLVDTRELILASFRAATQEVLGAALPDEAILPLIGIPLIEQMRILVPARAVELLASYTRHNVALHDELIESYVGVREMLETLAAEDRCMAVVTSKRNIPARSDLATFALDGFFAFVQGMEDTTTHKPQPGPLLEGARRLDVAPEQCIYIGDSSYDVLAARAAGMDAIAVLWGMGSEQQLVEAGARHLARFPLNLPALIRSIENENR